MKPVLFLAALLAFAAGCRGGVDDPASRFCQDALRQAQVPPDRLGAACDSCCHQDVVHRGRVENGRCACYP